MTQMPTVFNAVSEGFKLFNTLKGRAEGGSGASGTSEQRIKLSSPMEEVHNFVMESLEAAVLQEDQKMSKWP